MARVRSVQRGTQDVRVHSSEVDCFYQVVEDGAGGKILHLTTFGSDERRSSPKSSQSIQLDETMARELHELIIAVFSIA